MWQWPHFSRDEMACRGTGLCEMSSEFMDKLERLREAYGKPMIVTSGYRAPEYNEKVSKTGRSGPHTTGHAVDIGVSGEDALRLLQVAFMFGFSGYGIKQIGNARFIHLDDLPNSPGCPRPHIWSY